ncbi:hypothetical protein C8J57DRAFT_1114794 [Mycena rebaudengoi]|nr:hypothetical protein C8J57DRAFT_1114794 [Mycena rebaudengoi]
MSLRFLELKFRRLIIATVILFATAGVLVSWNQFYADPDRQSMYTLYADSHRPHGTTSRLVDLLFPPVSESLDEVTSRPWKIRTGKALRALISCLDRDNCRPNQEKVIIISSMYFQNNMIGQLGGEEIWANSTMSAMNKLGYTVLFGTDLVEAAQMYRMFPTLTKMVIVNNWDLPVCWKNKKGCIQSNKNPTGIPPHKLFTVYFWPYTNHPVGQQWVLSPEPYSLEPGNVANNTYLGYSIEDACALTPFIPTASRSNQAWILAKRLSYFTSPMEPAWSKEDYNEAEKRTGVKFALGAGLDDGQTKPPNGMALPDEYVNYGRMEKARFMSKIANSKVLIGNGLPLASPTPYDALCLGVPFINPLDTWDEDDPDDESKWHGQHKFMSMLGKPYVYNVRRGDRDNFIQAIKEALANPIPSYIPDRMRKSAVERRIAEIVDHDWAEEEKRQAEWCHEPCGCMTPCDIPRDEKA